MKINEHDQSAIRAVERKQKRRFRLPAYGILASMRVTLKAMLSRAVTVHYPDERVELPPRTRGVIALLEENCTVCMLCSKECPCWCIYIEGHKETKPGKRKAVNAIDRFAIDFGLCMYCGICVEVCPFDALHWSPAFEYTSFTYEGMVHELPVLTQWQHHVLPPPLLVDDADEDAKAKAVEANAKRTEGIHAVIREADKKAAYLEAQAASNVMPAPVTPFGPTPQAGSPTAVVAPDPSRTSDTPTAGAEVAATAPAASGTEAPAPVADTPSATSAPAADTNAGQTYGLPKIDPLRLPDGIGPVERGRLKKLAVLQERGTKPPDDLVANLKPILDQMSG